jgi:PPM family protein phosphatase
VSSPYDSKVGVDTKPMVAAKVRAAGDTNVGRVRTENEDSMVVEANLGLYAVFDGMGGANAGDVASQTARDTVVQFLSTRNREIAPKSLIVAALQAASSAIFSAAAATADRHGMGTTAVACLMIDPTRAIIAHVGDSRAYLLRDGHLRQLTRDHTVVEELVIRGLITAEDADRHPYKNVLSRNLGARPDPNVEAIELALQPGDRLLLCSDGLYGYAATESLQYILGSGDEPQQVCRDLIDVALRGGGGDNVTAVVVETVEVVPTATQVVRSTGSIAWWQKRKTFFAAVVARGFADSPMCVGMSEDQAIEVYAATLCQAIFHDLEKSSAVNVWTFAQSLAHGWLGQSGDWPALRGAFDILSESATAVVADIRSSDAKLGYLLGVALQRALAVAELAIGSILAERLRETEEQLVELYATAPRAPSDEGSGRFVEQQTVPFFRDSMPNLQSDLSPELQGAVRSVISDSRRRANSNEQLLQTLSAIEVVANDPGGGGIAVVAARDLYGVRSVDDAGISSLFEALDRARILTAAGINALQAPDPVKARVMRIMSRAQQRLVSSCTGLVIEAVAPSSDRLREAQHATTLLRAQVEKAESKRAALERKFATQAEPSLPWSR